MECCEKVTRWYDVSLWDLTKFCSKLALAAVPAVLAGFGGYVLFLVMVQVAVQVLAR